MSGKLSQHIIDKFKIQFEENCINLLIEGYEIAIKSGSKYSELEENDITVQLVGYMKKNTKSENYKIDISREYYIDDEDSYAGIKKADTSPRIDIRLMNWTSSSKVEYFMEAKNLSENNWIKKANSAKVDARKLQKRYIETGMEHFITGKYLNGCLIGYVVEGIPDLIVEKINNILISKSRKKEILIQSALYKYHFISIHDSKQLNKLKHFFLKFH